MVVINAVVVIESIASEVIVCVVDVLAIASHSPCSCLKVVVGAIMTAVL